jgi:hypothetical protein
MCAVSLLYVYQVVTYSSVQYNYIHGQELCVITLHARMLVEM